MRKASVGFCCTTRAMWYTQNGMQHKLMRDQMQHEPMGASIGAQLDHSTVDTHNVPATNQHGFLIT